MGSRLIGKIRSRRQEEDPLCTVHTDQKYENISVERQKRDQGVDGRVTET